jgi:hypothetical protein
MQADDVAQYRIDNVPPYNGNTMKIGVFGMNVSGGGMITKAPTRFVPMFEHDLLIAEAAEQFGIESESLMRKLNRLRNVSSLAGAAIGFAARRST